jgi:HD superfamily phosphohydrolase
MSETSFGKQANEIYGGFMSDGYKSIYDPVHRNITADGVFLDILDRHEMQRLRSVKQLDMGYMVFPGANHTRFEHCLGTYHLAGRMAASLGLSEEDTDAVKAAGLLHDVCHRPFSHALEEIAVERTGFDHMELAGKLISGEISTYRERDADLFGGLPTIGEVLEDSGISSRRVCELICMPESKREFDFDSREPFFKSGDYAHQIIHGPVDADQIDYLVRDEHYTGISWGAIDIDRIINTMAVHNDRIVLKRSGLVAAEGLTVSRSLMYSTVYYHKAVRVIKSMLTKAVEASESLDVNEIHTWDDADLTNALIAEGGKPSYLVRSMLNRRLYKSALTLYSEETDEETISVLAEYSKYSKRKALEREIADRAGLDISDVVVDMPSKTMILSKANIGKTDVSILDSQGRVRSLTRLSPIAKSIQTRDTFGWKLMVATPSEHKERVEKVTRKILNL